MSINDAATQSDILNSFFNGLRNKSPEVRLQSARELQKYVQNVTAELSSETVGRLWEDILPRCFELVRSSTTDMMGGILAIEHLLDIEQEETIEFRRNLFRLYNYIKDVLTCPDLTVMVAASKTLGHIVHKGGAAFDERFIDYEVPAAIELLQAERQELSRYAAVLILKELGENAKLSFHRHLSLVCEKLIIPMRDSRQFVREAAADLLACCLTILSGRDRATYAPVLQKLLADAAAGLKSTSADVVHGSLLTYQQLLIHGNMFMTEHFLDCADNILRLRTHKDILVRKSVIALIPTLAAYDSQSFSEYYMHKTMAYLMEQLERPIERRYAFSAIGYVATAAGSDMKQFLEPIMKQAVIGLTSKGKKNSAPPEDAIFECIGHLAVAVGPNLTKLLHDTLGYMFAFGLSKALVESLTRIVEHIPPLLRTIQERLLELLSVTLTGQDYRPLGAPLQFTRQNSVALPRDDTANKSPELIALALNTLGSFDFNGHTLNEFVRRAALPYLESDNPPVRQGAALTCCRLFVSDPICHQASNHSIEIISDVLDKLLTVGIADPDAHIRGVVLSNLDERFDRHLSQTENVRSLFIALNDEVYENRRKAIDLIGRMAMHNPAYVMPSLRKALIQLLTELQYTTNMKGKEQCTKLLTLLVAATQRLIKPYALPILKTLIPKANDPNPAVAANILSCLGELANVGGEEVTPYVPELMEIILARLVDPLPVKRDAAVVTLGQVCSSTGYVVQPLIDHPELLNMLGRILRSDSSKEIRKEVIRVLGILGAIDPHKRRTRLDDDEASKPPINVIPIITDPVSSSASDDYFQTVVINSLLVILSDHSLSNHHHTVIEAIMSIFKTQGLKCVAFLPRIIPAFASVTRTASTARFQEFHLQQLAILVGIIKQHIRNYVHEIHELITELWDNSSLQLPIVTLIEALAKALDAEFRPFIPPLLVQMLKAFEGDFGERKNTLIKIMDAFLTFGRNIEEYLHLVIPVIVKSYERFTSPMSLRKRAVLTIDGLSRRINFSDHASRIIHPLIRTLQDPNADLRVAVMDTLCSLVLQLGPDFAMFVPTINKCIIKYRIHHVHYDSLITRLLSGDSLPLDESLEQPRNDTLALPEFAAPADPAKMTVNQQHLKQAWDTSTVVTPHDWHEWMHRLSVELMKESPSHALRACMSLADIHPPLARELFNAAFLSCWTELYEQYQESLVISIQTAMTQGGVPSDIKDRLLNLAEFMEHEDKALPIENRTLGTYALTNNAFAKALHYKEIEFFAETTPAIIEDLISINTKLQQHDAAWGTLTLAQNQYDIERHEEWYERLGRWHEAKVIYEKKISQDPDAPGVILGRMRCLHALGDWRVLATYVEENWSNASNEGRDEIAPMAAAAAWALNEWDSMEEYLATMRSETPDRSFYKAILSVHRNQFTKALSHITKARELLDPELTAVIGESYGRTYNIMVRAQMLSELEEIIKFKQNADQPERQSTIRKIWMKRLTSCQPEVDVWQRFLQIRSLVLVPGDDAAMWIKFANLCRKNDRMQLADKTISSLLIPHDLRDRTVAPPDVVYSQLKFMWAQNLRDDALNYLRRFASNLAHDLQTESERPARVRVDPNKLKLEELSHLLARCYFKQGQWESERKESWSSSNIDEILESYHLATKHDPTWYKAWHTWALSNFEVIGHLQSADNNNNNNNVDDATGRNLVRRVIHAVEGFFKSIALRNDNSLQDILRLLTLWFKFGAHVDISNAMHNGFSLVNVDTWLEVIPQIIARIQTPSENIRNQISLLLTDVGKHHPQALVYPLTVASKSSSTARQTAARNILNRMRSHSEVLVNQALLVSEELIRVAILWHEQWHEALEEASRVYYTEKNPDGMIAILQPLHDQLEKGPKTVRESSFTQVFGRDLREAQAATTRYSKYGDQSELDKAWDIYYGVFKKVEKQMPQLTTLDLQYVSPDLLSARNLELAIPGTYQSGKPIVRIQMFSTKLTVISSKQRPRRLSMKGNDGRDYEYVLKGHEDLRQDERVMQLFGLVNTVLSIDTDSYKRRLHIQRFPVIPLAPNAGLIGWVQYSDTLHVLVRDYRESRKILLNIEYRLMLQMAPDYEILTLLQKVEVFEYALDNTTGQDLYRSLWLKSKSSEHWLERRATYTRSLAVNSMIGHILGLGDRHPSNLLIERPTGKVVHIDFGDCFEVAMNREKYPEKVPFRLTRMLTHAMEVSGIQGSFTNTCEISMTVLRNNRESLMAVLEALLYDPLINWRLLQADVENRRQDEFDDDRSELVKAAAYPQGPKRKLKADENDIFNETMGEPGARQEVANERALAVYNRVQNKLTGRDFNPDLPLTVPQQVERLISQATNLENLCQCFSGWCAFW